MVVWRDPRILSFLDFKKDLKVGLSEWYWQNLSYLCTLKECSFMCLRSTTSTSYGIEPPSLDGYFV